MDAEAAKLLGAGLAAIGVGMAALADGQQGRLFIGFAAAELLGLLAFVVAMILLFVA
jgi:F-type H+-transporting ATPase subunit c